MGVYSTSQFLGAAVGGILGGWLYQHGGLGLVFVGCASLGVIWLLAAATMREPPYVTSLRRPLTVQAVADSALVGRLLAIPGVSDAIVVAEEAALYIKVDTQQLDRALLEQVLEEAAETHSA
jgi:MFS family permease